MAVKNRIPGCTEYYCNNLNKQLQLKFEKTQFEWTDEWTKVFKEFYPVEGFKVKDRLPNCRDTNCRQLAKSLA